MTAYAFLPPAGGALIIADGVYAAPVYGESLSAAKSGFIDEVFRFSNYMRKNPPKDFEKSLNVVKINAAFDIENLSAEPFIGYVKISVKPAREFAVQTAFTFKCLYDGKNEDYSPVLAKLKAFAENVGVVTQGGGFMETAFDILDSDEVLSGESGGLICMLFTFILSGEAKKVKTASFKEDLFMFNV